MNKKTALKDFISGKIGMTEFKKQSEHIAFKIACLRIENDTIVLHWYGKTIKTYSKAQWQTERQNWCIIGSADVETEIQHNRDRNGGLICLDELSDTALIEVSRTPQGVTIGIVK